MWVPPVFRTAGPAADADLIDAHGFAQLVTSAGGLQATHLPLLLDRGAGPHGTLEGHMARQNPHWRVFDGGNEALAIFAGPHAYISPVWYPPGDKVPTWNYVAVHVYGRPRIVDDPARTERLLRRLSEKYEAPGGWSMGQMSESFLETMLKGIVAFDMPVERIEGKAKLSQNHPADKREGAIAGLRAADGDDNLAIAALMSGTL